MLLFLFSLSMNEVNVISYCSLLSFTLTHLIRQNVKKEYNLKSNIHRKSIFPFVPFILQLYLVKQEDLAWKEECEARCSASVLSHDRLRVGKSELSGQRHHRIMQPSNV